MDDTQRFVYLVWMEYKNEGLGLPYLEGVFETEAKANEWKDKWSNFSNTDNERWWISKRVLNS